MTVGGAGPVLWRPSRELLTQSNMATFMRGLERGFETYDELWRWSVDDLEGFWSAIWTHFGVQADGDPTVVLASREMPGARWFPDVALSYPERIFAGHADDQLAIQHASELRPLGRWTWGRLRAETARVRAGLRALGVDRGDRVVAYMPNIPETVAAFLATASLGAVWSSASPDFGVRSVVDRFAQLEPKVLLAVDGYRYGGRDFDRRRVVDELRAALPTLAGSVTLHYGDAHDDGWAQAFPATDEPLSFERVAFDHPLWILFSSGTTGLPKGIVHGHGGILLEHLKMLHLHIDARPDDRLFWFTTTGWMMWNFLVSGLLTQASVILFDGNPGAPDPEVLWDLAEETGMTCFGTGAAYVHGCMKSGVEPTRGRMLSRLKSLGSTGSPLSPEGFEWVYDHVASDIWLFSTSGGTDICSAFVGGTPLEPVFRGELQARSLGADLAAFDELGREVIDEVGELVIRQPMPSMPVGLWNDADGSRYRDAYFSTYPGVWRHGDWIRVTSRGTAVIEGRSDSTVNRGGIRIGTAEIYRAALAVPLVVDALVVDVPSEDATRDSWLPLFVVLADGAQLTDEVVAQIRRRIREDCSPRHVPSDVVAVGEIPRTISGKVLEVPVKRILMGAAPETVVSRDALASPAALDALLQAARGIAPARAAG